MNARDRSKKLKESLRGTYIFYASRIHLLNNFFNLTFCYLAYLRLKMPIRLSFKQQQGTAKTSGEMLSNLIQFTALSLSYFPTLLHEICHSFFVFSSMNLILRKSKLWRKGDEFPAHKRLSNRIIWEKVFWMQSGRLIDVTWVYTLSSSSRMRDALKFRGIAITFT